MVHQVAVDEEGTVLVWTGDGADTLRHPNAVPPDDAPEAPSRPCRWTSLAACAPGGRTPPAHRAVL